MIYPKKWIEQRKQFTSEELISKAVEVAKWIENYGHKEEDREVWEVVPGEEQEKNALLLSDTGLYGGAAGISLFFLRLYLATKEERWLEHAKAGINYSIFSYKGEADFETNTDFLKGAAIGYLNGPAGSAYVASRLYEVVGEEKYKEFAIRVTKDLIHSANEEEGTLYWYGTYGIIGEGSLILYLLDAYDTYGDEEFLKAARKAGRYILNRKEKAPNGGYRWYAMDTKLFPTIQKPGGYFPGFEYGAAGSGYILSLLYEYTEDLDFLETSKGAAEYITSLAVTSEDGKAALIPYNDTYLTDLFYLGVCQGPIGTSRLFYKLYEITKEESYKDFVLKLTNGILAAGAPAKHSPGYWRTNCYCCGAAGMLEHFVNVHKLTGDGIYLQAAHEAAETLIGESTYDFEKKITNWYTSWNRHEPWISKAYTGLYHGSAGCASSLIALAQYLKEESYTPYLEDPYKDLY